MISKVSIVAGGAGFIGVNLLPKLLSEGRHVVVLDNMSRGKESYVRSIPNLDQGRISVFACDCISSQSIDEYFQSAEKIGEIDEVWHLAANSDIPAGVLDANVDLRDTFMTTFELLQAMKRWNVPTLHFASSSAIYGDLGDTTLHEGIGPLLPISNYGAMKLASEALASAAAESYLKRVNLFRFPNVVGVPATHGVILDFVNKLLVTPDNLQVLGNGSQQKSYLHVSDLATAMLTIRGRQVVGKVNVVNIGPVDQGVTVRWIAEQVVARVSPRAVIEFGQGNKGWVGDVPRFNYSTDRLQSYGWSPALGSAAAITRAIDEIASQLGS
jgi:UDP-glucose 4-epimerase